MEKVLPKGWGEINLKEAVDFRKGKKPKVLSEEYFEGSVPYMDIQGLEKNIVSFYADSESAKYFKNNDVVIVWDGSRSGLILKPRSGAIGSTLGALSPYGYKSEYLYYFLLSQYEVINSKARGVGIPHVDPTYLWSLQLPLPPLAEQERIVAKLDKLFAQHEKIKAALDRIPQLLKNFRQQVLSQAVTGKLTEQWREGKDLEAWRSMRISELGELISGFAFKSSDFNDAGIQLIRMGNLYNNKLDLSRSPIFLPKDYEAKLIERYSTQKGDILLSLTGTKYKRDYGFAIEINTNEKLLINQRILCIRPSINSKYLLYLLRDNIFRDQFFALETGGVNQGNVGVTNLAKIALEIPSVQEQQEIVHRVENLFAKADTIESRYQTLKAKIDSLPQAILNKAFKGELVPQLSIDGDAKDLLADIMALKMETKGKRGKA